MYKVIIVDDEMIVRHAVKTLIKWEGSRFEYAGSAANGVAAWELAGRTGADIVITDIKMAEMDGLELIKKLLANGFRGEVLVLSNYNDFELVREALKCGAHDYMLKLTLKSEAFMSTLEEMAVKLDAKQQLLPSLMTEKRHDERTCLYELLKRAVQGEGILLNLLNNDERKAVSSMDRSYCYSFDVYLHEGEQHSDIPDILEKLADGLFPGKQYVFVIPAGINRFSLVITVTYSQNTAEPEEVAHRLIKLAEMYYGLALSVIYGQAALSFDELAAQIKLNKQADEYRFYAKYKEGCYSNTKQADDSDDQFHKAEIKLRESLRGSSGSAAQLWVESAFVLVESAAQHRIPARTLKRILSGSVWGLANTASLHNNHSWNEKVWIERMDAAESDSGLMLMIKDLSDELLGANKWNAPASSVRDEIRQALDYLDKHYSERVSISDVASHVGLSEPYLCQVFKIETGSSILTRLNEIRLIKAHDMLASGKYLVKQVAIEVGIPDPFYFNRLFRKRYGVAPKNVISRS